LVNLQKVDIEIKQFVDKRMKLNEPYENLKQLHEKTEKKLALLNEEVTQAKERIRKTESLLNVEKSKVKKWDERLKNIQSSRDFAAMQREIEIQKRINAEMEEELLKDMEIEETSSVNYEKENEAFEKLNQELTEEKQKFEASVSAIDAAITEQQRIRREIVPQIDENLLKRYEIVRKKRQGLAIVEVIDDRCQGCFMNIPPQLFNVIQTGKTIEVCPACNRFLYFKPLLEENTQNESDGKS